MLLTEQQETGTINFHHFYLRRILRIWPLYYLIVLVAPLIIPLPLGENAKLMVLLLLPNIPDALGQLGSLGFLWSIGVEEQFYIVLPALLRTVKRPLLIVAIVMAVQVACVFFVPDTERALTGQSVGDLNTTRFHVLALGVLAAALLVRNSRWLRFLYWRPLQLLAYVVALLFVVIDVPRTFYIATYIDFILAAAYATVILNVATNPKTFIRLDWRGTKALGQLSYPMYMTHNIIIAWLGQFHLSAIAMIAVTVSLTLIISALLHHLYERPFLALKNRLSMRQNTWTTPSEDALAAKSVSLRS